MGIVFYEAHHHPEPDFPVIFRFDTVRPAGGAGEQEHKAGPRRAPAGERQGEAGACLRKRCPLLLCGQQGRRDL